MAHTACQLLLETPLLAHLNILLDTDELLKKGNQSPSKQQSKLQPTPAALLFTPGIS